MIKNICIIVQHYYPRDVRVRKEVMALRSHGHHVSVIALCDHNEPKKEIINGVKVYRVSLQKKRAGALRYLLEYIAFFLYSIYKLNVLDLKEKFDVVHINTLPDFLVFCALIQKLKGRRIVLDMHEIMPEFFISKFRVGNGNPIVRLLLFLERISLKFADGVITVNEPIKRIFQKRAIPNRHIAVVMNTVDEATVERSRKLGHKSFNCVYHGTLTDMYGLDTAIEGFSKACRKVTDMAFHIFGDGPQFSNLKCLVEQLNLQQFIVFHGGLPHDRVMEWLAEMDLGILASRKDVFLNLSFSNKLAEYIYLKIPVISTDLDTTKYYFTDDHILYFEAGNTDDLAQKILFAYRNKEYIREMTELAFDRYKAYNWTIMAERYLKLVEGF